MPLYVVRALEGVLFIVVVAKAVGLTLNLLTTTIVAPPSNASKWQMGFNSAFKGLMGADHQMQNDHGTLRRPTSNIISNTGSFPA